MANSRMSKKNEDVMREFIDLYREKPCLWKIKSREYANKNMKEESYKILLDKLKEINEDAEKQDVIKKINSLRSCFRKEYKKVIDSKKSGAGTEDTYKPTLWYFDLLMFLKDQEIPREPVGFDTPTFIDEISQKESDTEDGEDVEVEERGEFQNSIPRTPETTISTKSSRSFDAKKRRGTKLNANNTESLMTLVHEKLKATRKEDEFDIIGKNVAEKLRNLPPQMKLFAEKLINDCLFEAQLGNLNRFATISIPQCQRSLEPYYSPAFEYSRGLLNIDTQLPEQRSNQGPSLLQSFATHRYPSAATPQSLQNSEMETNDLRSYYSDNVR